MIRPLLVLLLVLALGLASRLAPIGWPLYDHSLGDVLYAVAAYLALALVRPRWPPDGSRWSPWGGAFSSRRSRPRAFRRGSPRCCAG
jgi:hypothetical protein